MVAPGLPAGAITKLPDKKPESVRGTFRGSFRFNLDPL